MGSTAAVDEAGSRARNDGTLMTGDETLSSNELSAGWTECEESLSTGPISPFPFHFGTADSSTCRGEIGDVFGCFICRFSGIACAPSQYRTKGIESRGRIERRIRMLNERTGEAEYSPNTRVEERRIVTLDEFARDLALTTTENV